MRRLVLFWYKSRHFHTNSAHKIMLRNKRNVKMHCTEQVQDSRTWHTGGVNTSDAVRTSVVVRCLFRSMHVHTYIHTYIHTYVRTYVRTYVTYIHTNGAGTRRGGSMLKLDVRRLGLLVRTVRSCLPMYLMRFTRRRSRCTRIEYRGGIVAALCRRYSSAQYVCGTCMQNMKTII